MFMETCLLSQKKLKSSFKLRKTSWVMEDGATQGDHFLLGLLQAALFVFTEQLLKKYQMVLINKVITI